MSFILVQFLNDQNLTYLNAFILASVLIALSSFTRDTPCLSAHCSFFYSVTHNFIISCLRFNEFLLKLGVLNP